MTCKCKIEYQRNEHYAGHNVIVYCPLHEATPKMLEALIKLAIYKHYTCDDPWYSCPKSPEGCANDAAGELEGECTCGADEHNKEVRELAKKLGL